MYNFLDFSFGNAFTRQQWRTWKICWPTAAFFCSGRFLTHHIDFPCRLLSSSNSHIRLIQFVRVITLKMYVQMRYCHISLVCKVKGDSSDRSDRNDPKLDAVGKKIFRIEWQRCLEFSFPVILEDSILIKPNMKSILFINLKFSARGRKKESLRIWKVRFPNTKIPYKSLYIRWKN